MAYDVRLSNDEKGTVRTESFSDGVFAIAITLLVLELKVPRSDAVPLGRALLNQWPSYLSFLVSFATIGIMWLNHHRLFMVIQRADHRLLLLNLLLLLGITIVPFPTALLAAHLRGDDGQLVAVVYNVHALAITLFYMALWRHASKDNHLLAPDVNPEVIDRINRQYRFAPVAYLLAIGLAYVSVTSSIVFDGLLALFFALPLPSRRRLREE